MQYHKYDKQHQNLNTVLDTGVITNVTVRIQNAEGDEEDTRETTFQAVAEEYAKKPATLNMINIIFAQWLDKLCRMIHDIVGTSSSEYNAEPQSLLIPKSPLENEL